MQTFLPCLTYYESLNCLDNKRLGKQRVEAKQILMAVQNKTIAWKHHPAVKMWNGYPETLALYGYIACAIWRQRGFKDSLEDYFLPYAIFPKCYIKPIWFGTPAFHSAHRAILLAKNIAHYAQFHWPEEPAIKVNGKWPYIWPV